MSDSTTGNLLYALPRTLRSMMEELGKAGYHVDVRYDPARAAANWTVIVSCGMLCERTDTDAPLAVLGEHVRHHRFKQKATGSAPELGVVEHFGDAAGRVAMKREDEVRETTRCRLAAFAPPEGATYSRADCPCCDEGVLVEKATATAAERLRAYLDEHPNTLFKLHDNVETVNLTDEQQRVRDYIAMHPEEAEDAQSTGD